MRSLFVDTGAWVALLDAADPLHFRAREIFEAHRAWSLACSDLVLSETVTLLRRELGAERAAAFGRDVLDGKVASMLRCEMEDWREALNLIAKYADQRLSLADATSIALIRRLDIRTVASFDKHFRIVLPERQVVGVQP